MNTINWFLAYTFFVDSITSSKPRPQTDFLTLIMKFKETPTSAFPDGWKIEFYSLSYSVAL